MYAGIPIIGIAGGIGSGKSHVARLFGELGCTVIDSDAQVHAAYRDPAVLRTLRQWWGDEVLKPDGTINRAAVARTVFSDPVERHRLVALVHPIVDRARNREMLDVVESSRSGTLPLAFVWDTPLLYEAGLRNACDAVVFVEAPHEVRLERVGKSRGWGPDELARRENSQWPLDKKKNLSDDVIRNAAEAEDLLNQVRQVLSRILTRLSCLPGL
jgi:dephospho-CoA kinase